jgi:TFIIF-interacting CTD phosphatase-like protein
LPERVAKWRESQGQKTTAPQQTAQQPQQHQQQQQQRKYPNNDSMKNLLSDEIETMPPIPERSPERALSRDGR